MRIGIVDGYATSRFLVNELIERDVICIHIKSTPNPPSAYQRVFDPSIYLEDLGYEPETEAIVSRLRQLGIEQVLAGAESGVELADTLNHLLGTPGNDIAFLDARRNKFAMTEIIRTAGLASPESKVIQAADQAVDWFRSRGSGPVVVKPLASAGTDSVSICNSAAEVRERCESILGSTNFFGVVNSSLVVQEYLVGHEYMVNTVALGGVHKVVDAWWAVRLNGPYGAPIVDFVEPVPLDTEEMRQVMDYTIDVVQALGILNGAGHTEVMLTSTGPVLIECAARVMGGFLPWVSHRYSGTSQIHLLADSLTSPEIFEHFSYPTFSSHVRSVWLVNPAGGLGRADGWQRGIEQLPTFVALNSKVRPGQFIPPTVDLPSAPGFVYLAGTQADVQRDHRAIREMELQGLYVD